MNETDQDVRDWYSQVMDNLVYIISTYSSAPIVPENGAQIVQLADNALSLDWTSRGHVIYDIIKLIDYVTTPERLLGDLLSLDALSRGR